MPAGENKVAFANLLSYLATVRGKVSHTHMHLCRGWQYLTLHRFLQEGEHECLTFKLEGSITALEDWGHEYTRHLCAEIGEVHDARSSAGEAVDDLLKLVDVIIPFLIERNLEPEVPTNLPPMTLCLGLLLCDLSQQRSSCNCMGQGVSVAPVASNPGPAGQLDRPSRMLLVAFWDRHGRGWGARRREVGPRCPSTQERHRVSSFPAAGAQTSVSTPTVHTGCCEPHGVRSSTALCVTSDCRGVAV